jgi:hypothetical protein
VPAEPEGALETHTRVVIHLPSRKPGEAKVVKRFVKYLEGQRRKPFALKGYTHSNSSFPTFAGYWRPSTRGNFMQENVVLFLIDYEQSLESQAMLDNLSQIKRFLQGWYAEFTGKAQDEIWIVAHPIARVV